MFNNIDRPIIETNERISNTKRNLMIFYMVSNNIKNLKKLIKKNGIDIEIDRLNWTYLHYAAFHNNVDAAKELLKAGLKIDALDINNETPLSIAVSNESIDMVKFLIKRHANILNKNKFGYTALDMARIRNSYTKYRKERKNTSEIINILETKLLEQQKKEKAVISKIEKSR